VISGGPITRDITGEEYFSTIYAIEESPVRPGVIWVGANDGPIHVTRDGGQTWKNVTPEGLPPQGRVQTIEPSSVNAAKAYIAVYRYLLGDFRPYIYKTEDFGETWQLLTTGQNGIPADYPTRVIREDPKKQGLLYAGTEFGMFISLDDGKKWWSFQRNLPITPVTDIRLKNDDLVLSTMGRSFWIMDDISILRQGDDWNSNKTVIYQPRPAYRMRFRGTAEGEIPNYPLPGMDIRYYLHENTGTLQLKIFDQKENLIRSFTLEAVSEKEKDETDMQTGFRNEFKSDKLSGEQGAHTVRWDLRHDAKKSGNDQARRGPMVSPGAYRLDLVIGLKTHSTNVQVLIDPRVQASGISEDDLKKQEALSLQVQQLHFEAKEFESYIRDQIIDNETSLGIEALKAIQSEVTTAEGRYPEPMLIDQISYLYSMLDQADQLPGKDAYDRYHSLEKNLYNLKKKVGVRGIMD
jgi:photosystem II stability/assembly factor-like uncharacterized protein